MNKLFLLVLFYLFVAPILVAQTLPGPEVLFEYSRLISEQVSEKRVKFDLKTVKDIYTTREQNELEMAEVEEAALYGQEPVFLPEETQLTDTYNEVTISIPDGYSINKYIVIDSFDQNLYFPFTNDRSILIRSNDKDISFKLDYDLKLASNYDVNEIPTEYINQGLIMTIRYSPKYFTLKRDYEHQYQKQVKVQYKGKEINLNTEVYPILLITTPKGKDMVYVLEPNFQNLYNDFKFVREGHNLIYYRDLR